MHRVILAALLLLAACDTPPPPQVAFRGAADPIWSAAAFSPGEITGRWRQVAAYQAAAAGGCTAGGLEFRPTGDGLAVEGVLCLNGEARPVSGLARPVGPGRLAIDGQEDWWILWVDSGYRTLAVGTPSGRFGFVLDRSAASADRLEAAREVFDFNGYVAGGLRAF